MNARLPSGLVTLPKALSKPMPRYITQSGGSYLPIDTALALALAVRLHGTKEAVRKVAHNLVPKLCLEQQSKMRGIARLPDETFMIAVLAAINRTCELEGIRPEIPFTRVPNQVPKCHMKPMLLGKDGWFHCQHCSHTKPIDWVSHG